MFAAADRPDNIDRYTRLIAPHLDAATRTYWEGRDAFGRRRIARFTNGFYRYGLLGRFISMAHVAARMRGVNPRGIMKAGTRAEQIAFFNTHLSPLFDSRMVRCVLSHRAALYGLGIPPAQYSALVGDAPHMAEVIRERLRKLACDFDLSDNYFAWQAFNRGYKADGTGPVPPYLEEANFAHLRERIDRLTVHLDNYTQFLSRQPAASLDRFVLLDAQDWMSDTDLTALWTEITRPARPGARVIFRTAGHETILPGRVPPAILDRWSYAAERSAALTRQDRSAIYGGFHLYCLGSAT